MAAKTKCHSKYWFREFLRARFRSGHLVAASVARYLPHKQQYSRLWASRQRIIDEVAAEFSAVCIYGRRGGMWSAVYALPNVELDEELRLRALGERVRPGRNEMPIDYRGGISGWQAAKRSQLHRQRNWHVRRWRGQPFLCIRIPREKKWYDIRGYLVK